MKKCALCNVEDPASGFNKNKTKKDGLQSICRDCNKQKNRAYYKINAEKQKKQIFAARKIRQADTQEKLCDIFKASACVLCGISDPMVLEFDHLFDKVNDISAMLANYRSWESIEKEISKCQILCANCHKKKTHIEQNSYRARLMDR